MPIWQLCANLLIPNCLRSNLSCSPLAALELYVNKINPEEYNIYSVDIYPDSLVFAVNHRHTYTYPRIDTDKEGQFPFYQPYYLLIDMQLGGSWVGAVDPKELPVKMWVDWVKYYEKR